MSGSKRRSISVPLRARRGVYERLLGTAAIASRKKSNVGARAARTGSGLSLALTPERLGRPINQRGARALRPFEGQGDPRMDSRARRPPFCAGGHAIQAVSEIKQLTRNLR